MIFLSARWSSWIDRSKPANHSSCGTTRHECTSGHTWDRSDGKSGSGMFADGMMQLDWIVGELLKKLDDLGVAKDTIVVFTSDNGAEAFSWPDGGTVPFKGEKGTTWEGGFRVPGLVRWPGVVKPGTIYNDIFSWKIGCPPSWRQRASRILRRNC